MDEVSEHCSRLLILVPMCCALTREYASHICMFGVSRIHVAMQQPIENHV